MTSQEKNKFRRSKIWKDFVKENKKTHCDFCGGIVKEGGGCCHHHDPENYTFLNPDMFSWLHRKSCHIFIELFHKKKDLKEPLKSIIDKYFVQK
jgi:hypothetical protein